MPIGRLLLRQPDPNNDLHHIYNNNGTYYACFTVEFDYRTRRIRVSLQTAVRDEAKASRDELLARVARDGWEVPDQRPQRTRGHAAVNVPTADALTTPKARGCKQRNAV